MTATAPSSETVSAVKIVRYADLMTLIFTILVAAGSALVAARQWVRRRQKNRIDVYYIEIEQIARRTPNATRAQLKDMQRQLERVRTVSRRARLETAGDLTRVVIGPFKRRSEADSVAAKLAREVARLTEARTSVSQPPTIAVGRRRGLPVQFVIQAANMENHIPVLR